MVTSLIIANIKRRKISIQLSDGGELRIENPEGNQRQGDGDFVFHDSFGRGFIELTPVPPKIKVHGLGTRTNGNGQTMPHSIAYNKDIFNLFGTEHYNCLLYTSPSPRDGLLSRM